MRERPRWKRGEGHRSAYGDAKSSVTSGRWSEEAGVWRAAGAAPHESRTAPTRTSGNEWGTARDKSRHAG